jgi:hypothetical protein
MKMRKNHLLTFFVLSALFAFPAIARAQITIGENTPPNPQSVLDLRAGSSGNKGLLMPRVQLTAIDNPAPFINNGGNVLSGGMAVYHTGGNNLQEGVFVWRGSNWESLGDTWFYMPSIVFNTANPNPNVNIVVNLYDKYVEQFKTKAIASVGAPPLTSQVPQSNQYFYYVVGYDDTVFEIISLAANGDLTYRVIGDATDSTYINIVFVRK